MKRTLLTTTAVSILALTALFASGEARADANDFALGRFHKGIERGPWANGECTSAECILQVNADNELFKAFARDFGLVMSPRLMAPAETLGQAGFSLGVEASLAAIDNKAEHWLRAAPDETESPASTLSTLQIHVQKGLPFSFELGGTLTKLTQSDTFALGAELKWAFNEGFYYLPDIAVRGSVNRLVGNRDLDMLTGGIDVSISHPFGIGGLLAITPYAGWNLLFVSASSHVLDATPGLPGFTPPYCGLDGSDQRNPDPDVPGAFSTSSECQKAAHAAETADYRSNFVLSRQRISVHRGFAGLGFRVTVVTLLVEAMVAEQVKTYSLRLAMDF